MLRLYGNLLRQQKHSSSSITTHRGGLKMADVLNMSSLRSLIGSLSVGSLVNVKTLLIIFAILNLKSLHFVWFVRRPQRRA